MVVSRLAPSPPRPGTSQSGWAASRVSPLTALTAYYQAWSSRQRTSACSHRGRGPARANQSDIPSRARSTHASRGTPTSRCLRGTASGPRIPANAAIKLSSSSSVAIPTPSPAATFGRPAMSFGWTEQQQRRTRQKTCDSAPGGGQARTWPVWKMAERFRSVIEEADEIRDMIGASSEVRANEMIGWIAVYGFPFAALVNLFAFAFSEPGSILRGWTFGGLEIWLVLAWIAASLALVVVPRVVVQRRDHAWRKRLEKGQRPIKKGEYGNWRMRCPPSTHPAMCVNVDEFAKIALIDANQGLNGPPPSTLVWPHPPHHVGTTVGTRRSLNAT